MDDEKFGVKIIAEFIQSSFSSALSKIKTFEKTVGEDIKVGIGIGEEQGNLSEINASLTEMQNRIEQIRLDPKWFNTSALRDEWLSLTARVQEAQRAVNALSKSNVTKFGAQLGSLKTKAIQLKNALIKLKEDDPFKKMKKTIKQAVTGLIGFRAVYTGIRKAMSTYLAQNEELQNKLNACWYALGSLLAPALEFLLNIFVKLVSYVDAFVKGLGFAGINMKNFNKNAKDGTKSVNKMLAGFDEINNISSQDQGGAGASIENPFENVDVDTKWMDRVKEFGEWCSTRLPEIIGLIAGIAIALKLIELGFSPLQSLGIGLAIAGIITLVSDVIALINDPSWQNWLAVILDIGVVIAGLAVAFGLVSGGWAVALLAIGALVLTFKDEIIEYLGILWDGIVEIWNNLKRDTIELWNRIVEDVKEKINGFVQKVKDKFREMKESTVALWDALKTALVNAGEEMKNKISTAFTNLKTKVVNAFNSIKTGVVNAFTTMKNNVKTIANSVISVIENMVNRVIDGINWLTSGLRGLGNTITEALGFGTVFNSLSHISLPRLATGTNYVPNDMIAMIHQGEAVVPKKFNNEEFLGQGNEETNYLLRQLINIVDTKEFRAYISQNEVGKSAVNYINKQSRILGGALV